jgi:hypothetical protein
MRRKGVPKKNEDGFEIMDLRQDLIVFWIGKPFEAFSMIALFFFAEELALFNTSSQSGR